MSEAKFIDQTQPLSPGVDYLALRQRGLDIIQQLAGHVWTDYNEHDPGVTTLEQLCYALTELSYRSELPIEDLIADPGTNAIDPIRQRLLPPEAILPGGPVTTDDYRKIIADRVPSVGNLWLRPHRAAEPDGLNGLYEIEIYVPGGPSGSAPRDVVEQVRQAYAATRGLCEDLHSAQVLEAIPATLTTTVAIEPAARLESVAARILYQVSCLLAPEIRRESLESLLATGQAPSSIFDGPLLHRGFVSDTQLEARRDRFTIGDLARVLREVPGVTGVHKARLSSPVGSLDTAAGASAIAIPPRSVLVLDTEDNGGTGIRLVQGGVEYRPEPRAVLRELARLWTDHRRDYNVGEECARLLSIPAGTAVDSRAYQLLQHQFPGVYGINEHGVPSDATAARHAQARQLKGFLLVFEQLLADGFARLASATQGASHDPVYQRLDASFPELEPLLKPSYRTGVRTMEDPGRAANRLWRVRRTMLASYGETAEPLLASSSLLAAPGADPRDEAARVAGQLGFLRQLPKIGSRRGIGFDYRAAASPDNTSGLEIRTRLQLGLRPEAPPRFDEMLQRFGLTDVVDAPPVSDRALMMRHTRHIDQQFVPVPELFAPSPASAQKVPFELSEELLTAGAAPQHYRIGSLPGDEARWTVVCRAPAQPLWQLVGTYEDRTQALADAAVVLKAARAIHRQARRLYLVEHPLLRFAPVDAGETESGFDLSFTVSAVVCVPVREAVDPEFRERVCDILRANTPAHVVVHGCFLRFSRIREFETLYWRWREALRTGDRREDASRRLRDFLRPNLP